MTGQRISVNRELYVLALSDAVAWQSSILRTHDPDGPSPVSCCKLGARCEQYKKEAHTLARYTAAQSQLRRRHAVNSLCVCDAYGGCPQGCPHCDVCGGADDDPVSVPGQTDTEGVADTEEMT